jgi:glutamine synthetase
MLYIPSLLVSHYGHALDDKTLFRQSQLLLKNNSLNLLSKLGIKTESVLMLLGLEQEFFAISKSSFNLRPDIRLLGRSLVGNVPARNQQFGEHYYGKMNTKVQKAI